jgi:hypothetical protein
MAWRSKIWFVAVSILYVLIVGYFGSLSFETTLELAETGTWQPSDHFFVPSSPGSWYGAALWGASVVLVQLHRLTCSLIRGQSVQHTPPKRTFMGWQIGVQGKFLLLLLLVPLIAFAGHVVFSGIKR